MSREDNGPSPFLIIVFVWTLFMVTAFMVTAIGYRLKVHGERLDALEKAIKVEAPK